MPEPNPCHRARAAIELTNVIVYAASASRSQLSRVRLTAVHFDKNFEFAKDLYQAMRYSWISRLSCALPISGSLAPIRTFAAATSAFRPLTVLSTFLNSGIAALSASIRERTLVRA